MWVGSLTIRAGDFHVGIRTDDDAVLTDLHALYSDRHVDDDRSDDYSISVTPAGDGPSRPLPCLAHGRRAVLRSRSVPRLLRRLDLELAALEEPPDPGLPAIAGFSLVTNHRTASLVPSAVVSRSTSIERILPPAGLGLAEEAAVRLDLTALEAVVLPGLSGGTDHPALRDEFTATAGRYDIRSIVWAVDEVDGENERAALAVLRLIPRLRGRTGLAPQELLDRVANLAVRSHPVPAEPTGANLRDLLGSITT